MRSKWPLSILLWITLVLGISGTDSDRPKSRSHDVRATEDTTLPELDRQGDIREIVDTGLWPVYVLYTGFVGSAVQFRYLTDLEAEVGQFTSFSQMGDSFRSDWQEWVFYFIGFIVCAAVGIVACLAMLISLIAVPSCRCRGKCGAKFDPMDNKKSDMQRLSCSITLVIFNCILVLGATCMFAANEHIKDQLSGETTMFDNINSGLEEVPVFLHQSVNEINVSVLQMYDSSKDKIFVQLYALPVTALSAINEETQLRDTYTQLDSFADSLAPLDQTLDTIRRKSNTLKSNASSLDTALSKVKIDILNELQGCNTSECYVAGNLTEDLKMNVNYSVVDVNAAALATQAAINQSLPDYIKYVGGNITKIRHEVNATVYTFVREANDEANKIQNDIEKVVGDLEETVNNIDLTDITSTLQDVEETVEHEHIDDIIYWSILVLSSTLCLIVLTNLVALIHGFACPRPSNRDSCSDCNTRQASRWLLTSAAFTFAFYWVYVLVVLATFIAGGIIYSEVCRNVIQFNEPDSVGVLNTLDRLINDTITEESDLKSVAVFDAYRQCERDSTVYVAFRLAENGYNLTAMLDLSAVEDAINEIKKQSINLQSIALYSPELESILNVLQNNMHLDYDSMITELENKVTTVDLNELANVLENLSFDTALLNVSIQTLRELANDVTEIETLAASTKSDIQYVMMNISGINFATLGMSLNASEIFIEEKGDQVLNDFVDETADEVYLNITIVANVIISDIENNVANCRPVYDTVTTLIDDTCVRALYPLNVVWFSLGWCLFFLIPHLVLTMKLSKLYKKTVPYVKDYQGDDFPEEMQLQPVVMAGRPPAPYNKMSVYDDHHAFDNVAFDPLEDYRQEIARREARKHSANGGIPPPAYGEAKLPGPGYAIPRPRVNISSGADQDIISANPLRTKVPAPAYGEVNISDPHLAYMY